MTTARKEIVDPKVTPYYHCISRCVRQAMLCGEGKEHRKRWLEKRIELLTEVFAIGVLSHSVMDNHLHSVVALEPERADRWNASDVLSRWYRVYNPPKYVNANDPESLRAYIAEARKDREFVAKIRSRLTDLGWFMKSLKEPLARLANEEDECTGAFWEPRYKSIALLDEAAVLAACVYVDLNPLAAGTVRFPEQSPFTSIRHRIEHVLSHQDGSSVLRTAKDAHTAASRELLSKIEATHWLSPVQDRRGNGGERRGMSDRLSLAGYLLLVDYTSRVVRDGKARVKESEKRIFDRLGGDAEAWSLRVRYLLGRPKIYGVYMAGNSGTIATVARAKKRRCLINALPEEGKPAEGQEE